MPASRTSPHMALSVESWADLIRSRIPDPHVAAWAASIVYWDFGTEEAAKVMQPLMANYDKRKSATDKTEAVVEALRMVGYRDPEARCVLRQDLVRTNRKEWGNPRYRGV